MILDLSNENLIIFVGAGVSKNSNVPTWGALVRQYAYALGYKQELSTDDYLKIPQYFYSSDDSYHHEAYYNILKDSFENHYDTNILDDLIVSMKPDHIITTNYDHLLDHYGYEVITSDRDLLKSKGSHFLLKMHGDLDCIEEIVFREDDYLRYSQTHSIMELYIKSLLIDHTFLFVGYSLNDYNLKTFMSWIDYLGIENNVKESMHSHYLITNDILPEQDYLISYYKQKHIEVININSMSEELIEESKNVDLEDDIGRRTYVVLKHIKR